MTGQRHYLAVRFSRCEMRQRDTVAEILSQCLESCKLGLITHTQARSVLSIEKYSSTTE